MLITSYKALRDFIHFAGFKHAHHNKIAAKLTATRKLCGRYNVSNHQERGPKRSPEQLPRQGDYKQMNSNPKANDLTHCGRNNMADILQAMFWNSFFITTSLKFVTKGPVDNKFALVQIIYQMVFNHQQSTNSKVGHVFSMVVWLSMIFKNALLSR